MTTLAEIAPYLLHDWMLESPMNEEQVAKWWRWGPDVVRMDLNNAVRDWTETLYYAEMAEAEQHHTAMMVRHASENLLPGENDHCGLSYQMTVSSSTNVARAKDALVACDAVLEVVGREQPPPTDLVNKIFPVYTTGRRAA